MNIYMIKENKNKSVKKKPRAVNHGKRYSSEDKTVLDQGANTVISRRHMEDVVAPKLAGELGREISPICKQIEKRLGKHFQENF